MEQRRPAEDVIRGLATTSAKIQALADAGYDRTEISQLLGIRYQHITVNVTLILPKTSGLKLRSRDGPGWSIERSEDGE